jgi:oligopeptide/dipeptide ABC transporter ATP-binding protein
MSDIDETGARGPALPSPQDVRGDEAGAPQPLPSTEDVLRDEPLLRLDKVSKSFPVHSSRIFTRTHEFVHAVDDVSLEVYPGETLGLVGETGCGKSTLARCIARLYDLTSGSVNFDGKDISHLSRRDMRPLRREIQMIFQDPYGSLNPRRRVGSIIGDPFVIHGIDSRADRKKKVQDLMELVGLNPEHYNRFPSEFSGGQRQRIGTARALALRPRMVVCDEPVSALDVSIQAQIINLLKDLQDDFGLTYIFISHDLSVVRHVSDRIAVMYLGNIVEVAPSSEIFENTRHPYTRALLSALPVADPDTADRRKRIVLVGDIPSPTNPPSGCRFHTRCPKARPDCVKTNPMLEQVFDDGAEHLTACLHPLASGEDITLAKPQIEDSEILMAPNPAAETSTGGTQ